MLTPTSPTALFIDGRWKSPDGGHEAVVNPATEDVIGHAPLAGADDVEAAIAAARHAFDHGPWRRMKVEQRAAKLAEMCDVFEQQGDAIRALIVAEAGATQAFTRGFQFGVALEHARFYIGRACRPAMTSLPVEIADGAGGRKVLGAAVAVREPVGVCTVITAFNVPFMLNVTKTFPALLMGNTVVLKPSPLTPLQAVVVAQAAHAVGLPAGVLNVVNGGVAIGRALTTDPRVDLVSFTGSDTVGAIIQAQTAPTLKRCVLELGGKSALIVREDADLDAAAASAMISLTGHAGQACAATGRLVVHNRVRASFVGKLAELFGQVRVGDPADPQTRMGPLIRAAQRDHVESLVATAVQDGARLVAGGRRPAGLKRGFFYEPTLLDDVDNGWRISREEVFGPVGAVIGFDDDEQAIAIANDSDFGLAGGIFSADVGRAFEIALEIRTGKFQINGGSGKMSSYQPFGGIKRSGYGREFGDEGLNEFTYLKSIAFHGG